MGFVKTAEEVARFQSLGEDTVYGAEMLRVKWETRADVIARLLPPPLRPVGPPIATAYLASFPRTNYAEHLPPYREAELSIPAEFDGSQGQYVLAMPVTNDMAMAFGRELFGFPKKIADIAFERRGSEAGGWAERYGTRFFELRANLSGTFNSPDAASAFRREGPGTYFTFKHAFSADRSGFDYSPRLITGRTAGQWEVVQPGEAEVVLRPSPHDPWFEVEVVRVLGAVYVRGTMVLGDGKVVAEVDPQAFLPYSFLRID